MRRWESNTGSEPRLALSIRQPYVELILRGIKTVELRSRRTRVVGERFYLYASAGRTRRPAWSADLVAARPPAWMVELARQVGMIDEAALETLPRGLIVGSAVVDRVIEPAREGDPFQWVLRDVERLSRPRRPTRQAQPVWFRPW